MKKHKDIQNPEDYTDKNYQKWEYLLLDPDTNRKDLEEIVMTLAHLPTEEAQELLKKFEQSDRASEVSWLEPAMDEGKMWLLDPINEQEEQDLIALKLYFKKQDQIVDLMGKCDNYHYSIAFMNIELEALTQMEREDSDPGKQKEIGYRVLALKDLITRAQHHLKEAEKDIEMEDKISDKIKASITTKRYQNLEEWDIDGFHFDGEEW